MKSTRARATVRKKSMRHNSHNSPVVWGNWLHGQRDCYCTQLVDNCGVCMLQVANHIFWYAALGHHNHQSICIQYGCICSLTNERSYLHQDSGEQKLCSCILDKVPRWNISNILYKNSDHILFHTPMKQ